MLFQQSQTKRHPRHPSPKKQQGVVIVVALFIVAIVTTMTYVMMSRLERDTRRTSLILRDGQAEFFAQGSIAWARDELRNNWEKKKPNQLVDRLPITSPEVEMNGFKVRSTIHDLQGRYNLNNLKEPDSTNDFKKLLKTIVPNLTEEKANEIVRGIVDWISPAAQFAEYNKYYLELPEAYRSAHRPMLTISELRLVKGITQELFNALQPYVTALPNTTQINVQSANPYVLMTLSPTMNLDTAKAIVALRNANPFVTIDKFKNLDIVKNHNIKDDKFTVTSAYFLVETEVAIEKQKVVLYTLLERTAKDNKDNKGRVRILGQSKGVW